MFVGIPSPVFTNKHTECDRYWPDPSLSPAQEWEVQHRRYERAQRLQARAAAREDAADLQGSADNAAAAEAAAAAMAADAESDDSGLLLISFFREDDSNSNAKCLH